MNMLLSNHVINCPSCGRPVEIKSDSLGREKVCGHCHKRIVIRRSENHLPNVSTIGEKLKIEKSDQSPPTQDRMDCESQTLILVEDRDEVFARIAADVEQFGMSLVRAKTIEQALFLVGKYEYPLVVANCNLPNQNGWLLTDKLSLLAPHIEIWLYMPLISDFSEELASFLKVTELIAYRGDLLKLSEAITQLLVNYHEPCNVYSEPQKLIAA